MLSILFGLSGSGKNFVGEILARDFGYYFWDADTVLLPEMRECIKQKKPFTQTMRDDFTRSIINKVTELKNQHPKLAIAQALYKEKNRQEILAAFPDAQLVWIKSTPEKIVERLTKRNASIDIEYAQQISRYFEATKLPHLEIVNTSDEQAIINQLPTNMR
jgi:gluconokinase